MTASLSPRRPDIELIESGAPSARLRLITGYYGSLAGLLAALLAVSVLVGDPVVPAALDHPERAAIAVVLLVSVGQTWRLLRTRRRSAAIAAAIPLVVGVASYFLHAPILWSPVLASLVSLGLLATVWKELE